MIGSPTKPEDHSQHGAYSWRDYFKFNTDHKVIGVQYVGTTFIFFLIGGLFAEVFRAELAHTGMNVDDARGLQRPHVAARDADGLHLPGADLRGHRQLRDPADAGRAGHGLPAPQRPQLLDAAARRHHVPGRLLLRQLQQRLDGLPDAVGAVAVRPDDVLARHPARRRLVDRHGRQLPGHHRDDARARA